jgi:hypothetical protein
MEGFETDKPPFFDGMHFVYWKARMEFYMQSIDLDLWDVVLDGFSSRPKQSWNAYDRKCFSLNVRAMQMLRSGLNDEAYSEIKSCSSAKDIWDTLDALHLANNSFVHKVVCGEQEKQKPLKEAYVEKCSQEDVQSIERSLMPLDNDDIQFNEEAKPNRIGKRTCS